MSESVNTDGVTVQETEGPLRAEGLSALPVRNLSQWPHLAALRLDDGDYDLLRRQGFVATESRGQKSYFKLRFRRDGRQVVRYIGDHYQANAVAQELSQLQRGRQLQQELRKFQQDFDRLMREAKCAIAPFIEAEGFKFHGRAIRYSRKQKNPVLS